MSNNFDIDHFTLDLHLNNDQSKFGQEKLPIQLKFYDYYDEMKQLVKLLSIKRATENDLWLQVGQCLHNISNTMLHSWIEFSQRNSKYVNGSCEKIWPTFHHNSTRIGSSSLHHWAKSDNLIEYNLICEKELNQKILKSQDKTSQNVASVIHQLYRYQYKCAVIRGNIWYHFNGHRWHLEENALKLKSSINDEVVEAYLKLINSGTVKIDPNRPINIPQRLTDISKKLKDAKYRDKLVKECQSLFFDSNFMLDLDNDRLSLGFDNGVYNLGIHQFHDGRPEDNISLTTHIKYIPYNANHPKIIEIDQFMSQLFPNPKNKQYMYVLISSLLEGHNPYEKFHVWIGSEASGLRTLIELITNCMGDYAKQCNANLFAHGSNVYHSALIKETRAIFMIGQSSDKLNLGLIKEWTGNDRIHCSINGRDPIDYKPQSKLIYCCSKPPPVFNEDMGLQRRLNIIEFEPIQRGLLINKDNLNDYKESFMSVLLHYYVEYKKIGLVEARNALLSGNKC